MCYLLFINYEFSKNDVTLTFCNEIVVMSIKSYENIHKYRLSWVIKNKINITMSSKLMERNVSQSGVTKLSKVDTD